MNQKKMKKFWQISVGEVLLWPLPALLAAFAHLYAFPKAGMLGTGPGIHLLMNEKTISAQQAWHFVDSLPRPFLLYALLLVAIYVLLRIRHVKFSYRMIVFFLTAIPGLWYFKVASMPIRLTHQPTTHSGQGIDDRVW